MAAAINLPGERLTVPGVRDYAREISDAFAKHGLQTLLQPIRPAAVGSLAPVNAVTGKPYLAANAVLLLTSPAARQDRQDPRWATVEQIMGQDWDLKKGAQGQTVEYWQTHRRGTDGERLKLERPRVFHATVFHASQIDGIPARNLRAIGSLVALGEAIKDASPVPFLHDQARGRSFYSRSDQTVHLPAADMYPDAATYHGDVVRGIASYEAHRRAVDADRPVVIGSLEHAQQELRSHMAALIISAETGLPYSPSRNDTAARNMARAVQAEKFEFFHAARDASVIAKEVLSRGYEVLRERSDRSPSYNPDIWPEFDKAGDTPERAATQDLASDLAAIAVELDADERPLSRGAENTPAAGRSDDRFSPAVPDGLARAMLADLGAQQRLAEERYDLDPSEANRGAREEISSTLGSVEVLAFDLEQDGAAPSGIASAILKHIERTKQVAIVEQVTRSFDSEDALAHAFGRASGAATALNTAYSTVNRFDPALVRGLIGRAADRLVETGRAELGDLSATRPSRQTDPTASPDLDHHDGPPVPEPYAAVTRSQWQMDDDGRREVRVSVGRHIDAGTYHYSVESSVNGGEPILSGWSDSYPTADEAKTAAYQAAYPELGEPSQARAADTPTRSETNDPRPVSPIVTVPSRHRQVVEVGMER
jgi:antirestriction protein ArdC